MKSTNQGISSEIKFNQSDTEIQKAGTVVNRPLSLDAKVRLTSANALNQILADTMTLRDLYKKHHWQVAGPTFYQLHLLYDKHYEEQSELVDTLAERIQTLGGVALAMAHDIAEISKIERPPKGRENFTIQLLRLLRAHELIIGEVRAAAHEADDNGDDTTNDILVSNVLRTNEFQVWFISEQLAGSGVLDKAEDEIATPLVAQNKDSK